MEKTIPRFMSIREVAKTGLLSEYTLRLMEKQKLLPCVYSGRKCLINFDRLVEQLNNSTQWEVKWIDSKKKRPPCCWRSRTGRTGTSLGKRQFPQRFYHGHGVDFKVPAAGARKWPPSSRPGANHRLARAGGAAADPPRAAAAYSHSQQQQRRLLFSGKPTGAGSLCSFFASSCRSDPGSGKGH